MKRDKYIGLDVHQAMTVVAVMNADGKIVLETMVSTEAAPIRGLIESLNGPLHVTLEEGTQAQWLHEVIRDLVKEVVVCDPKRNKLLMEGSKGDKPDARKLAELLRVGMLRSVWHGHEQTRGLKQMVRAYETFTIDTKRTMLRIKAIYRGRGIATGGSGVYQATQREQWLGQIPEAGMRQRAAWLYEQLDQVQKLRKPAKAGMLAESRHLSEQAAVLELQRSGRRHAEQRGVRICGRSYPAAIQTGGHTGIEPELQSATEVGLRLRRRRRWSERSLAGVSGESQRERAAARDGLAHSGAEDCDSSSDNLEERRNVRSQETEFNTIAVFESIHCRRNRHGRRSRKRRGSRVRICLSCRPRTLSKGHVLSLSPLAGPETAIALEAQIDLWSALVVPNLLFSFRTPSRCCTARS